VVLTTLGGRVDGLTIEVGDGGGEVRGRKQCRRPKGVIWRGCAIDYVEFTSKCRIALPRAIRDSVGPLVIVVFTGCGMVMEVLF